MFESYKIPNFNVEALNVVVNTARSAAYRAPAAPLTAYAVETVLDEIAEELGIDPMDLRLRNAVTEGDLSTMGFPFARIGFVECLEAVRDHPHYSAPLGPNQGRGLAAGYWFNIGESSSATVNLNEDGTATVVTGSPDIGGSRASMALMAAEELGIDPYDIRPVVGDTEAVGFTDVTEGSRATFATGMAVVEACRKMVAELRARAAKMMGVDLEDVEWVDGRAVYSGSDGEKGPLALADITAKAKRTGGPLTATGSLEAHGAGPGFAVHLCDVEVDSETGVVRIVRYTASQDAGTAIHPSYVEGQIQGGVAQGVGLGAQRGVHLRLRRRDGEPQLPRLPGAGGLRLAHDRRHHRGGPQPRPSLRRARRGRDRHRAPHSRGGQRHLQRHRPPFARPCPCRPSGCWRPSPPTAAATATARQSPKDGVWRPRST